MPQSEQETAFVKIRPSIIAIVPCVVSVLLLAQVKNTYGSSFTNFVATERATVQILVQIVSHGLGLTQIYSLRICYKFSRRLRAFREPFRLENIGFWAAISSGQIDWSVSLARTILSAVILLVSIIPGALWAGALTPVIVQQELLSDTTIAVPAFSQSSTDIWNNEFQMQGFELWNMVQNCKGSGLVTTCPVPALEGSLLSTVSSASTQGGVVRSHAKIDSADWSYLGRSYGVGASLGLATPTYSRFIDSISYTEYGFATEAKCIFNGSAAYSVELLDEVYEDGWPSSISVIVATGSLPNSFDEGIGEGVGELYEVLSIKYDSANALAWSARAIGGRNYISIAAGLHSNYSQFNQAQCQVDFTPSAFNVSANLTSKQITVTRKTVTSISDNLLPNSTVAINAMNSLNLLSRMSSSLYTSTLGDALIRNLASAAGVDPSTSTIANSVILGSLEDCFEAVLDDILGAYGASQVKLADDTAPRPIHASGLATRVGEGIYIYAIFGFSSLVVLLHIVELIRTRFWSGLLIFDIFDVRSVGVAASVGGNGIARDIQSRAGSRYEQGFNSSRRGQGLWRGNADDKNLAALRVRFWASGQAYDMPALTSAEQGRRMELLDSGAGRRFVDSNHSQEVDSQTQLIQHYRVDSSPLAEVRY